MKKVLTYTLYILAFLLFFGWMAALLVLTDREKQLLDCNAIDITVSGEDEFVSTEDVQKVLDRLEEYIGQRLYSIDLYRIESALNAQEAIAESQAWITRNGLLHVDVRQRKPVLMVTNGKGEGYYADIDGNIFSCKSDYKADVPEIECKLVRGMDQEWLKQAIALVYRLSQDEVWHERINSYSIAENDDLILHSQNEKFIFGDFSEVDRKLRYIDRYFTRISPLDEGYRTVNVKYKGHILCRKKGI